MFDFSARKNILGLYQQLNLSLQKDFSNEAINPGKLTYLMESQIVSQETITWIRKYVYSRGNRQFVCVYLPTVVSSMLSRSRAMATITSTKRRDSRQRWTQPPSRVPATHSYTTVMLLFSVTKSFFYLIVSCTRHY